MGLNNPDEFDPKGSSCKPRFPFSFVTPSTFNGYEESLFGSIKKWSRFLVARAPRNVAYVVTLRDNVPKSLREKWGEFHFVKFY